MTPESTDMSAEGGAVRPAEVLARALHGPEWDGLTDAYTVEDMVAALLALTPEDQPVVLCPDGTLRALEPAVCRHCPDNRGWVDREKVDGGTEPWPCLDHPHGLLRLVPLAAPQAPEPTEGERQHG
jgi:hypothetical protein